MYYRFRNIKSLLDYKELENEEIFFASPSRLNDPMEGIKDIAWQGDGIVWKSLLKHYLLSLNHAVFLFTLDGDNICEVPKCFEKQMLSRLNIIEMIKVFFNDEIVKQIIDYLVYLKEPIRRGELISYLKIIHPIALKIVAKAMRIEDVFNADTDISNMDHNKLANAIEEQKKLKLNSKEREDLFRKILNFYDTFNIILVEKNTNNKKFKEVLFLKNNFVHNYINKIEDFIIPHWYTACFMTECENSSLWGYYGDNHEGVCLIFETDENSNQIKIRQKNGFIVSKEGCINQYSWDNMEFLKVDYKKELATIDFFNSLIKIVQLKEIYQKQWFCDEKENMSEVYKKYLNNKEEWKKDYLEKWNNIIIRKDIAWKSENECRLVLNDFWNEYDTNGFPLQYDFFKLKGIIFGIKATNENKYKILQILKSKGKNEHNFSFYQAYYDESSGNIKKYRIPLFEAEEIYQKQIEIRDK